MTTFESAPVTDDLDHTALHGDRVEAAVDRTGHYLIQQECHQVLVRDKSPQVNVQVVGVHLHLLKTEPASKSWHTEIITLGQRKD